MRLRSRAAVRLSRSYARAATVAATRLPRTWPLVRGPLRLIFEKAAPRWDAMRDPEHLAAFEVAIAALDDPPRHALDVGTGTGAAALAIARRFPDAEVVGVDIAEAMLAEARRKTPAEVARRVCFEPADAAALPFGADSFDLVTLANMIPFFDELGRVLRPGGSAVFSFSTGPSTPIYVSPERLREELAERGFDEFRDFRAGKGTALLARKHALR